jgi:hypothetical protein
MILAVEKAVGPKPNEIMVQKYWLFFIISDLEGNIKTVC